MYNSIQYFNELG